MIEWMLIDKRSILDVGQPIFGNNQKLIQP